MGIIPDLLPYLIGDRLHRYQLGLCRVKALYEIRSEEYDRSQFLFGLNAFGKSHHSVDVTVIDDLSYEMSLLGIVLHPAQKGSVYLHIIGHVSEKILDIGISRSVIVYRSLYVEYTESVLELSKLLIIELGFFREFDNDRVVILGNKIPDILPVVIGEDCLGNTVYKDFLAVKITAVSVYQIENV